MVEKELRELLIRIEEQKCEAQTIEVKAANKGCPEKLYDTISAFSNQDSGGVFVFGLDESQGFKRVGVYDAQDIQKKVMEYCEQLTPVVRPLFTVCREDDMNFVSAEIPPVDMTERPCFKTSKGRLHGSYIRVGDADKSMTEYEVYSYEAFRKKYRDDIRPAERDTLDSLDSDKLDEYIIIRKQNRPNLSRIPIEQIYELTGVTSGGKLTLTSVLLFGQYPQAFYPQLCVIATSVPGTEIGVLDEEGRRFTDSQRIEGTLPEMLEGSIAFVRKNMRVSTKIDAETGKRTDIPQYPMDAVREAVLNALVHRDYSIHTEGMPIQLVIYSDRLEITNPGGLYGRLTVDQLGKMQPDTRNPILVTAMEALGLTENRYSGIERIRHAMKEMSLPQPVFEDIRGSFKVTLYNSSAVAASHTKSKGDIDDPKSLLEFCRTPRSREDIYIYLGITSKQYAFNRYVAPLIKAGLIRLTIPEKPHSPNQRFVAADN